jgi:hypothetical protein
LIDLKANKCSISGEEIIRLVIDDNLKKSDTVSLTHLKN